jgi:hypothetical protein
MEKKEALGVSLAQPYLDPDGVGILTALSPMSASAEPGGVPAEIAALQAQVQDLQATVSKLQGQISSLQSRLKGFESNPALALAPYVTVSLGSINGVNGPNIIFTGANIHIRSGLGSTDDNGTPRGLGNLIIGYDEDPKNYADRSSFNNLPLSPLIAGDRGGSHNLVIGAANRFTQAAFGGLVVARRTPSRVMGPASPAGLATPLSIMGQASAVVSQTLLAASTAASAAGALIAPPVPIAASAAVTVISLAPTVAAPVALPLASAAARAMSPAAITAASPAGLAIRPSFSIHTSVTGGTGNTAGSLVIFQGGLGASVIGGAGNNAAGRNTVAISGQQFTDNKDNSLAPQPPFPWLQPI